jgi:hypothetical protein
MAGISPQEDAKSCAQACRAAPSNSGRGYAASSLVALPLCAFFVGSFDVSGTLNLDRFVRKLLTTSVLCGNNLFEAQIAARRVPAYFAVRQPRVTDCVLILIAEQSKADLRNTSRTNFSHCVNDDFGSPQFAGSDYTDPGCFSSQSFWKAGSARKGSHIGSNLRSAGVIGIP